MKNIKISKKWPRNFIALFLSISAFTISSKKIYGQELDTNKLDRLFDSLEERNEAMGSITISKNDRILYSRAIGYQYVSEHEKIPADTDTKYRIWSITKTYTATMILQLVEEGKLTLETRLKKFFPNIPNSGIITIKDMLSHKSGIHDFTQEQEEAPPFIQGDTRDIIVKNIARFNPDFQPNQKFEYSNSNYLLLGFIIEDLDRESYGIALSKRISSRIGLSNTFFGAGSLDSISNKAFSYQFDRKWINVEEGDFSGSIPGGAGSIVSTPTDMAKFIEALFKGRLISQSSLAKIIKGEEYGLGIYRMPFEDKIGFGHTGSFIASESSLTYYPQDSMVIAYTTNGIAYEKEKILDYVLRIYHNKPFAISFNRKLLGMILLSIFLVGFIVVRLKFGTFLHTEKLLSLGYLIPVVFSIGMLIAGFLYGDYNQLKQYIEILSSFYCNSGTFFATIQLVIALLTIPFVIGLFRSCKKLKINFLPVIFIIFVLPVMLISALYPELKSIGILAGISILLVIIGPLLALVMWRRKEFSGIRILSAICITCMSVPVLISLMPASFSALTNEYFGAIQRLFYLGWSLWFVSLSYYFKRAL